MLYAKNVMLKIIMKMLYAMNYHEVIMLMTKITSITLKNKSLNIIKAYYSRKVLSGYN